MSVEVVVFPDLVKALIPYVSTKLVGLGQTGATVSNRVPSPRPAKLVRLAVVGGSRINVAQQSVRLLGECWAESEGPAERLAQLTSAIIEAATRSPEPVAPGVWIGANPEDFSVPVNYPDPLASVPRFQFYCSLVLTGSAI